MAYSSYWISPRGFANEGFHLYGETEKCLAIAETFDANYDAIVTLYSTHKSLEAARERAVRERQVIAAASRGEAYTKVIYADDWGL